MRPAIKIIVILVFIMSVLYLTSSKIIELAIRKNIPKVISHLEKNGIFCEYITFESARLFSFNSLSLKNVYSKFNTSNKFISLQDLTVKIHCYQINIKLKKLLNPSFVFSIDHFTLNVEKNVAGVGLPFGGFEHGYFRQNDPIELGHIEEPVGTIIHHLSELMLENQIPTSFSFNTIASLTIGDKNIRINLYTQSEDSVTFLRMKKEDIQNAVKNLELEVSPEEIDILSHFPLRTPLIIEHTLKAKELSERYKKANQAFPDDAFKHVLWSYWLTRSFGVEFAKKITDAHETLPNNTSAERNMDFHNNQIGQKYAPKNLSVDEIYSLVLSDPNVIRCANEQKTLK